MELTARQICTEPRDKIYGLVGLIDYRLRHRIRPDYTSLTFEAYRLAFVAFSQYSKSLDLLAHCSIETRFQEVRLEYRTGREPLKQNSIRGKISIALHCIVVQSGGLFGLARLL